MSSSKPPPLQIDLVETTVAEIDGVRVGLANVWDEAFVDASGRSQQGVRATICLMRGEQGEDTDHRVAFGDRLPIAGKTYRVAALHEGEARGALTLEIVPDEVSPTTGPPRRTPWLDGLLLLPFLFLPYAATAPGWRAVWALLGLVAWVLLLRPTWRGLLGFYGGALLLLHALLQAGLALRAGLFG